MLSPSYCQHQGKVNGGQGQLVPLHPLFSWEHRGDRRRRRGKGCRPAWGCPDEEVFVH